VRDDGAHDREDGDEAQPFASHGVVGAGIAGIGDEDDGGGGDRRCRRAAAAAAYPKAVRDCARIPATAPDSSAPIHVSLKKNPPDSRWLRTNEAGSPTIQLIDEAIDDPNQRIAGHQHVQPLQLAYCRSTPSLYPAINASGGDRRSFGSAAFAPSGFSHSRMMPSFFRPPAHEPVRVAFDGGRLASDADVLVLAESERGLEIVERLARRWPAALPRHEPPSRRQWPCRKNPLRALPSCGDHRPRAMPAPRRAYRVQLAGRPKPAVRIAGTLRSRDRAISARTGLECIPPPIRPCCWPNRGDSRSDGRAAPRSCAREWSPARIPGCS
jgi:hypothetical protein